jgi:hypothetical protein
VMKRFFKWLTEISITLILFVWFGFLLLEVGYQHFYFLNHEINRKIVAKNPNWLQSRDANEGIDVTDTLPDGFGASEIRKVLSEAGYSCSDMKSNEFSCERAANKFEFVCIKRLAVAITENVIAKSTTAKARFELTCL